MNNKLILISLTVILLSCNPNNQEIIDIHKAGTETQYSTQQAENINNEKMANMQALDNQLQDKLIEDDKKLQVLQNKKFPIDEDDTHEDSLEEHLMEQNELEIYNLKKEITDIKQQLAATKNEITDSL